jgi:hypothetical protein
MKYCQVWQSLGNPYFAIPALALALLEVAWHLVP